MKKKVGLVFCDWKAPAGEIIDDLIKLLPQFGVHAVAVTGDDNYTMAISRVKLTDAEIADLNENGLESKVNTESE